MKTEDDTQLPLDTIPLAEKDTKKPRRERSPNKSTILRTRAITVVLTLVALAVGLAIYVGVSSIVGAYSDTTKFRAIIEQELIAPCGESYVKRKIDKTAATALCWMDYKIGAEERVSGKEITRAAIIESNGRHYTTDGKVLVSATLDGGRMQIHLPSHSKRWPCVAEPECNTRIAATLIRENYARFNGDKKLARTAYNRGHGAVSQAILDGENPDPRGYARKYEAIHF